MDSLTHLRIPKAAQAAAYGVLQHTDSFCSEHLDSEYAELCRRLTARLARKRPTPLGRGDAKIWAAGVLYEIGSMNFLSDRNQQPHLSTDQISKLIGVSKATMANKGRLIRDLLKLRQFDPDLMRRQVLAGLPGAWLIEVSGILVDARTLSTTMQEEAHRQGLIPDPSLARWPGEQAYSS